jgi:hypothetical protein
MKLLQIVFACLGLLALDGCRRPYRPPVTSDRVSGGRMPSCPDNITLSPTNDCDGYFTSEGHACVNCPGGVAQCELTSYGIYCANNCKHDPVCSYQRTPDPR